MSERRKKVQILLQDVRKCLTTVNWRDQRDNDRVGERERASSYSHTHRIRNNTKQCMRVTKGISVHTDSSITRTRDMCLERKRKKGGRKTSTSVRAKEKKKSRAFCFLFIFFCLFHSPNDDMTHAMSSVGWKRVKVISLSLSLFAKWKRSQCDAARGNWIVSHSPFNSISISSYRLAYSSSDSCVSWADSSARMAAIYLQMNG